MAICHPEVKRVHQMRQTAAIVTGIICISTILIAPVVFSAYFLCAMVVVAFLLPCTLLTYFYARIILRLRRQIRTMLQSRIPIKRITIYTLVVTLFYFACQIPYWLPQIYLIFAKIFHLSLSPDFIKITHVAHMLPFLAAAFNWIFYAQLNSHFKKGLILVTERMHRKMTRTGRKRVADTMDELCIEIMSRSEEAPNCVCPNCEQPLSIKVQAQSQTARVWDHGDVALLELETDIDTSDDLGKRVCLEARGLTLKEPMLAFGMGDGKIQKLSSDEQDTFCGRGKATTKANIL
ncbi:unnamed protein product, partial [Mesorhabditis belari]|uniref:G-protein coupled receptors family 1 profile domain-containing protein n=1 Tax=Mesorhabditis belari TaxID=2138241 RepID=A0AAF3J3I1_9BILA